MEAPTNKRVVVEGIITILVLGCCALAEGVLLIRGAPKGLDGVVLGRILGTLDAAVMLVLSYWFGSTRSSMDQVQAITDIGKAAANAPIHVTTTAGETKDTTVAIEAMQAVTPVPTGFQNIR